MVSAIAQITHHAQKRVLDLGVAMDQSELVKVVCHHRRVRRVHVPSNVSAAQRGDSPMVVRRQPDRHTQTPLQVPFSCVHFEQLEQSLCAELGVEAALERVLGFLLVV